jgi:hypothetical protein
MKSRKALVITLLSVFIIVAILIGVLFAVLATYSRYQYAQALKVKSEKHSKHSYEKEDDKKIDVFGKVTFLVGNSRRKGRKDKTWKKLRFGQKLSRGDSIRVGTDSRLELTLKNDKTISIEGYKKMRIDNSLLRMSEKSYVHDEAGGSEEGGKISRLTGKEDNKKETTPVSAIRSNVPGPKEDDKKDALKTKIGN